MNSEDSAGYTFFFQIADDGRRRACCVKVDAADIHEASALFRQKWPVIELMARDGIKSGGAGDGVITLVMPRSAPSPVNRRRTRRGNS